MIGSDSEERSLRKSELDVLVGACTKHAVVSLEMHFSIIENIRNDVQRSRKMGMIVFKLRQLIGFYVKLESEQRASHVLGDILADFIDEKAVISCRQFNDGQYIAAHGICTIINF